MRVSEEIVLRSVGCNASEGYSILPLYMGIFYIDINIYLLTAIWCHPVAVVQYIFTHKQYAGRHKTNNT